MFLPSISPLGRLRELVRELRRTREERDQARRRAAPFSRGQPKGHPQRPGRKPGAAHGPHHRRPIPDHGDQEITVAAPEQCPDCGGPLTVERGESQYQEEILRRTWVRGFHIPICRCAQCRKRVQGRHPLQTSDALRAAAVQVRPEAVTLGVLMNKSLGLPHADAAAILKQGFGLTMRRSRIGRAIQRVARKAEAAWHALRDAARRSALAHMAETGWKVEAQWRWLWAVVTEQITLCETLPGRGLAEAAARFPLAVKRLLEPELALPDRYLRQEISLHGLGTATGRLEAKLDRLLARSYRDPANRRLANHLRHERPCLFTFLYCPGLVHATNNLVERVMGAVVVIRKNWGGNRTENGARAQAVLTSLLRTAQQQDQNVFQRRSDLLRSPQPRLLDVLAKDVTVTEATPVDCVVDGGGVEAPAPPPDGLAEIRFPGSAVLPVLPDRLSLPGVEAIFSSA